jgi:phage terminase large subunit-like protein
LTKKIENNLDPCTAYAQDVADGRIVAGPHVRAACQRHLDDLEHGHERGLSWHPVEVERVIGFFSEVLTVEREVYDEFLEETISEVVPFKVEPSQAFILGNLFGWKNKHGHRRFRRCYIEIGKGNGKSPMAAGIGHYMMLATKKLRAEIYSAATDKDQAAILFRDAVEMWRRSPHLHHRLTSSGQNPVWQLTYHSTSSFFKPISSEKKGKSGIRPYCALIDEVHEHPNNEVIEMLRAGTKGNQQALIFEITNSGMDLDSTCGREHEYSIKIANGELKNDAWFSYVCALDEGDDPFEDESCWEKANPLMGVAIFPEFVREQVQEAKGMPSKESMVRRLHFCQWTEGGEEWITRKAWKAIERPLKLEDYAGMRCWGGLDLSYTTDLSALALVFEPESQRYHCFVRFWKPKEGLSAAIRRDRQPYDLWVQNGHLHLTEGRVIKLAPIAQYLAECYDRFDLQCYVYDAYRHRELQDDMLDLGVELPMQEHPQGFRRAKDIQLWMPKSVQDLENAITEDRIRVQENPLLRWNAASTVVREDPAGTDNKIFDKRKSRARIDGIVALAMGVGAATVRQKPVFPMSLEQIVVDL